MPKHKYNFNWKLSTQGNCWDDFKNNEGFPTHYVISGDGDGIDWHPCGGIQEDIYLPVTGTKNTTSENVNPLP